MKEESATVSVGEHMLKRPSTSRQKADESELL
jgi:hypothetical protein